MAAGDVEDQPWEGGVSVPVLPPHVPLFDSAAVVVAQQTDAQAGVAVAYNRGIFTRQAWSTGLSRLWVIPGGGWRRGGRAWR